MKPDWDKLMGLHEGSKTVLIADVDCTADGKTLCTRIGVKGYPTIKHGDPSSLVDYEGGRDFDSLKKFANGLKPSCSPANIDLCDDDMKAKIKELEALSDEELAAKIAEGEDEIQKAEKTFEDELAKLQSQYEQLMKDKEAVQKEVKDSGLGLMKSVLAASNNPEDDAKEEL